MGYEASAYDVAIVGMSGRFPKANNINDLWSNITSGKDCIERTPEKNKGNYVAAYGKLDNIDFFDAEFFNTNKREALDSDPQQRFLLEGIYEAVEDSGYNLDKYDGRVGLYASCDEHVYVWNYIMNLPGDWHENYHQFMFHCDGTFLTRIAYKLNLQGPCMLVKYACASSMASLHIACQGLLEYECDMAIAGAVSIEPEQDGYYTADATLSSSGFVKAFDKKADGFVPGHAQGIVVLKRLKDAIEDHDNIVAIIKGTSVNNDGNRKVGFAAPSVAGQEECIWDALNVAGLQTDDISYFETHGTATVLGDSVELRALKNVFRDKEKPLYIGSLKSNIGHTNAAAGISNVIKVALMLKNKMLPPSINYLEPNEELEDENCPLLINNELIEWHSDKPRFAGASAFGMGGANAIAILSEYSAERIYEARDVKQVFVVSGRSEKALINNCANLKKHFKENDTSVTDAAYTLQIGREHFNKRYSFVAQTKEEVMNTLDSQIISKEVLKTKDIIFAFTGSGSLGDSIGLELYHSSMYFRAELDRCFSQIKDDLQINLKEMFLGYANRRAEICSDVVSGMLMTYTIGFTLAKLWLHIGVKPLMLIGHSLGEYTCAAIADIFSFAEGAQLIFNRAQLFDSLPEGKMLSVSAKVNEIEALLPEGATIGAVNAEQRLMVSGSVHDVNKAKTILEKHNIRCTELKVNRAGHCEMVKKICPEFSKLLNKINFKTPKINIFSSCDASLDTEHNMSTTEYWLRQCYQPVRFYDSVKELSKDKGRIWIEIGTSDQLAPCIKKTLRGNKESKVISSITLGRGDSCAGFYNAIGNIWEAGIDIEWELLHESRPFRTPLPTYAFERKSYWRYKKGSKTSSTNDPVIISDNEESVLEEQQKSLVRNETDRILVQIFKDALELDELNIYEDLFELGYDSLSIVLILKQIESQLSKKISLQEIYNFKNIGEIADYLDTLQTSAIESVTEEDDDRKSLEQLFDEL
ncbi:acyltransferase domain-containing protein [Lachnospiraceae bacterium ZAX-1]